jgi:predicted DCC family thiol-disulfide oxidoreductase YuxK
MTPFRRATQCDPEKRMASSIQPGVDTVLYDGDCRFCRAQIRFLQRADRRGRLAFVPMHRDMREMVVVDKSGKRHGGGDAVRYLTRKLPVFWPIAIILHIPGTRRLWAWLYRKVAARRYWFGRITCDSESCGLE